MGSQPSRTFSFLAALELSLLTPGARAADCNDNGIPDDRDIAGGASLDCNHLFNAGRIPACREAADADNDASIDLTDPIYLLSYLFLSGNPPAPPGAPLGPCGVDPDSPGSPGDLGCDSYGRC